MRLCFSRYACVFWSRQHEFTHIHDHLLAFYAGFVRPCININQSQSSATTSTVCIMTQLEESVFVIGMSHCQPLVHSILLRCWWQPTSAIIFYNVCQNVVIRETSGDGSKAESQGGQHRWTLLWKGQMEKIDWKVSYVSSNWVKLVSRSLETQQIYPTRCRQSWWKESKARKEEFQKDLCLKKKKKNWVCAQSEEMKIRGRRRKEKGEGINWGGESGNDGNNINGKKKNKSCLSNIWSNIWCMKMGNL